MPGSKLHPRAYAPAACAVLLAGLGLLCALRAAAAEPLRMGIFPRGDPAAVAQMFDPLAAHLSRELGREVHVQTTADFASFWENVAARRYDIVHYNQYHYVRSHKEHGYRVILSNEEFGQGHIAAAIVVRKDSGIASLADLKGRKIVFGGGRTAMVSFIGASHLLRQAGLQEGDYFTQFALTPLKACIATYYRQAAAAGAGDQVLQMSPVRGEIDPDQMRYLATGEALAHLPWATKEDMPAALAERIQALGVAQKDTGAGRRILAAA